MCHALLQDPKFLTLLVRIDHEFAAQCRADGCRCGGDLHRVASVAKCSPDSALRDINDLVVRGVLCKADGGGHSTGYVLIELPR